MPGSYSKFVLSLVDLKLRRIEILIALCSVGCVVQDEVSTCCNWSSSILCSNPPLHGFGFARYLQQHHHTRLQGLFLTTISTFSVLFNQHWSFIFIQILLHGILIHTIKIKNTKSTYYIVIIISN